MTKQEKSEKLSKFLADRGLTQKRIADKLGEVSHALLCK